MLGGSIEGFYLSRFENLSQERVLAAASALVEAAEHLPSLHVLEITFFSSSVAQSVRYVHIIKWHEFIDYTSILTIKLHVSSPI
jgi:hypothetical protein